MTTRVAAAAIPLQCEMSPPFLHASFNPVPSSLITVGIETSGTIGSVAVLRDGVLLAERTLGETGRRHARTLIAELDELLKGENIGPKTVDDVAVSIGPGSFTGLRVGVVAAKCWAFVTGCRVLGVGTFEAVAVMLETSATTAWIIDDALRGDLYVQKCERDNRGWRPVTDVSLMPLDAWLQSTRPGETVSGPNAAKWSAEIAAKGLLLAPVDAHRPSAANVARCGFVAASAGRFDDPFQLVPLYIRRTAAEEKFDAQTAAGQTP